MSLRCKCGITSMITALIFYMICGVLTFTTDLQLFPLAVTVLLGVVFINAVLFIHWIWTET